MGSSSIPHQVYRQAAARMLASYRPPSAAFASYFSALTKSNFCMLIVNIERQGVTTMKRFFKVIFPAMFMWLAFAAPSGAQMMGPGPGMMASAMTNGGTFGMMNGMAGSPVLGDDGTAYLVTYVPGSNPGSVPSNNSFQSRIIAVTPAGSVFSMIVSGIVSRPVVFGNLLVASASLPNFSDYTMWTSFGNNPPSGQSVVYLVSLPFSTAAKPVAVSVDGSFASTPVVDGTRNRILVTTTDFGYGMMSGSNTYNTMYGNYSFNTATAKTYMYMLNFDGTYTRVTLQ
jgi:hypothetical protein